MWMLTSQLIASQVSLSIHAMANWLMQHYTKSVDSPCLKDKKQKQQQQQKSQNPMKQESMAPFWGFEFWCVFLG